MVPLNPRSTFISHRIFRTDYGHTEVAAHFGNGKEKTVIVFLITLNIFSDPREYCISTKEFVVDDEGKLEGLNTGKDSHSTSFTPPYFIPISSTR